MTNGSDLPRVNPVAESIWRDAQVLSSFGNPEVNRQLFQFGAPNSDVCEYELEVALPTLSNSVNLAKSPGTWKWAIGAESFIRNGPIWGDRKSTRLNSSHL